MAAIGGGDVLLRGARALRRGGLRARRRPLDGRAGLGRAARRVDDAVARLRASIELAQSIGDRDDLTWALELLGVAYAESRGVRAARLGGAAESLRASLGSRLEGIELALHERALAALGDDHEVAWAAGAELSPEEAAELALSP